MKSVLSLLMLQALVFCGLQASEVVREAEFDKKPSPDRIYTAMKNGNMRFIKGECIHPRSSAERVKLASVSNQKDYALVTILSCSDSRVPVELIFDAGIMDLFVIRTPGNICKSNEVGGIEYGIHHVYTPLVVILGHSDCGAVTTAVKGTGKLERNIPGLLEPIRKVVDRARKGYPGISEEELIKLCIRENVYYEIKILFERSAATRNIVKKGKVKVLGGIYDIDSGKVEWLDAVKINKILAMVEAGEARETKEFED